MRTEWLVARLRNAKRRHGVKAEGLPLEAGIAEYAKTEALRGRQAGLHGRGKSRYDYEMVKKYQKATDKPGRIKIKLLGLRNHAELQAMMTEVKIELDALNVPCLDEITLYATMKDPAGKILVPRRERQPVTEITVKAPYRSIADEHGV